MSSMIQGDVLIKGGLLVNGEGITRSDILISDGKVLELGPDLGRERAIEL